jgi:hypothetical protein
MPSRRAPRAGAVAHSGDAAAQRNLDARRTPGGPGTGECGRRLWTPPVDAVMAIGPDAAVTIGRFWV